MSFPLAERQPAPGSCKYCNFDPGAAMPKGSAEQWNYVTFVDALTWLCPLCGMPNEKADNKEPGTAVASDALAVEVPVLAPPAGQPPGDAEGVSGAVLAREGSEAPSVPAGPENGVGLAVRDASADYPSADAASLAELQMPGDNPPIPVLQVPNEGGARESAELIGDLISQLNNMRETVDHIRNSLLPQLYESDVDPFTLVETLLAFGTTAQLLNVSQAEIASVVGTALQMLSSATVIPPELSTPEPTLEGTET